MTVKNDCEKIEVKFVELRENLWRIAIQNDVVNPGEMNLMKKLDDNVQKIRTILSRLKQSNKKVENTDKKLLNNLLQKTFDNSVSIAKSDKHIDREEIGLLRLIRDSIKNVHLIVKQM